MLLEELLRSTSSGTFLPYRFFIAWNGVPVLVYRGYPRPFVHLKQQVTAAFSELRKESPGSLVPKTTLGAISQTAPPLSLAQLQQLKQICALFEERFSLSQQESEEENKEERKQLRKCKVKAKKLSIVTYCNRSLEKVMSCQTISLKEEERGEEGEEDKEAKVDDNVVEMIKEWNEEEVYLQRVNCCNEESKHFPNREEHYRESKMGVTLVCYLQHQQTESKGLLAVIREFRKAVDDVFGKGFFVWFEEDALHVTLRGLIG
ncbi:DUF4743 domain-containing protein [Balamuthia mandrillaris]